MSAVHWGLLLFGLFGLLTSSVYLGMVLVGARRFRREAVREEARLRGAAGISAADQSLQTAAWRRGGTGGESPDIF